MGSVFRCLYSLEEDSPEIDFQVAENARHDWLTVGQVLDRTRPVEDCPKQISIVVPHPEATEWNGYMVAGTTGLFSSQFLEAIDASSLRFFIPLPVALNGVTYFFLRCIQPVDCLDYKQAILERFQHNPDRIKRITHFAFHDDRLPDDALFCIPECPFLLVTQSAATRIEAARLKGVQIRSLP